MPSHRVVLKFGSSVLRSAADLSRVVDEIYRHVRDGQRVVAVVSAFAGETDRLLATARARGARCDEHAVAALVATGEQTSAALLALALDESGIPARLVQPRDFGLLADGEPLDSAPVDLDLGLLQLHLLGASVSVIPGFIAQDRAGHLVLLGRGGSDLSAIFIAHRLQARCVLIKDVDGLYVSDPALPGPRPARFSAANWADATRVGGELVQPKALEWARVHHWPFDIAALGSARGTHVNASASFTVSDGAARALRVVLLGLGVVGRGVYERLKLYPEHFQIERILIRHTDKHVAGGIPAALMTTDASEIARIDCDLVIEALGAGEPALTLVQSALEAGKSVVTANKANVACNGRLQRFLTGERPALHCSAAVGGAVPILKVIQTLRQQSAVTRVRAVLNGTCNYVLERLNEGSSYHAALNEARAQGFAEADPQVDVSGLDAAAKLRLVALQAFDAMPSVLDCQGIAGLLSGAVEAARPARLVHKLVATLTTDHGRVVGRVAPELLHADDFLAGARFEHNRCEIELKSGARMQLQGRGAGRWPTATAVMGDVWSVARSVAHG